MIQELKLFKYLLSNSKILKSYMSDVYYHKRIDIKQSLQNPNLLSFVSLQDMEDNIDGGPQTFVIVSDNKQVIAIISRDDENTIDDCYYKHCLYEYDYSLDRFLTLLEDSKGFQILSINTIYFIEKKKKQFIPYDLEFYYEEKRNNRYKQSIELQIFKEIYTVLQRHTPSIENLTYEYVFKQQLDKCITDILNSRLNKYLNTITFWQTSLSEFELDYGRKRVYIDVRIKYRYEDSNGKEYQITYGNIIPIWKHFRCDKLNDHNTLDVLKMTWFDTVAQIMNGFLYCIENSDIRCVINNLAMNGFKQEYINKIATI